MTTISADFNNIVDDGLLRVSSRRAGSLRLDEIVTVVDPGEAQEYTARVAQVGSGAYLLEVEWEPSMTVLSQNVHITTAPNGWWGAGWNAFTYGAAAKFEQYSRPTPYVSGARV